MGILDSIEIYLGWDAGFFGLLLGIVFIMVVMLFLARLEVNGRVLVLGLFGISTLNVFLLEWPTVVLLILGGLVAAVFLGGMTSHE